ncbi:hypothetical protein I551_5237 [Mycobacterium ulcerans str. Harvey]|uniref:Uncharacterized protein n=1 Tax=Mycobacterium ulcerans str. Harvey TaxID=1299332 RepID=A0ABP3AFF2_MYCUL|nr:hypothetical protein I551_5237 [Mycobacterium ulcerans str. Harvey]
MAIPEATTPAVSARERILGPHTICSVGAASGPSAPMR